MKKSNDKFMQISRMYQIYKCRLTNNYLLQEVMFSPGFVCVCVCLSVSRITKELSISYIKKLAELTAGVQGQID